MFAKEHGANEYKEECGMRSKRLRTANKPTSFGLKHTDGG